MHPSVINPFRPVSRSSTQFSSSLTNVHEETPKEKSDEPFLKHQQQLKIFGAIIPLPKGLE